MKILHVLLQVMLVYNDYVKMVLHHVILLGWIDVVHELAVFHKMTMDVQINVPLNYLIDVVMVLFRLQIEMEM